MSVQRICDGCQREVPTGERFYDVALGVFVSPGAQSISLSESRADFCYLCAKTGKGLQILFASYEAQQKKTAVRA